MFMQVPQTPMGDENFLAWRNAREVSSPGSFDYEYFKIYLMNLRREQRETAWKIAARNRRYDVMKADAAKGIVFA
jgi:hypothetical protein